MSSNPSISISQGPLSALTAIASDKAIWLIAGTLIAVGLYSPAQLGETLSFTGDTLLFLLPFLILAFGLAGYMKASSAEVVITEVFHGRPLTMIAAAAVFGAWSPLCSCTVIAMIAVLLRSGMPLSAVMAFWISSPIISPDMYVYTAALLGVEFATVKMIAAAFMGLFAGYLIYSAEQAGLFKSPLKSGEVIQRKGLGTPKKPHWKFWKEPERVAIFWDETKKVSLLLGKWMVFAFILESLMIAYIPSEVIGEWVGQSSYWAIPLATITGVPAYVNGVAAVPLIQGLIEIGMSKSAALAFLTAGSVTSIPAMMAVFPLVKKSVFVVYIAIALVSSVIVGYGYQFYLSF